MSNHQLAFFSPWYLVLLGLIPLLWMLSFRSLAGLGQVRRLLALTLRSLVVALLIFALAEAQWVRSSERLTVLYVIDQSLSISRGASEEALKYVNEAIRTQRNRPLGRSRRRAGLRPRSRHRIAAAGRRATGHRHRSRG